MDLWTEAIVCQILEGGERAFLERERRYRLRWGYNLLEEPDLSNTGGNGV